MAHTDTTNTNTIRGIYTDADAMEAISAIAEANPYALRKDIDALLEVGEVDCETVWAGYLADAVADTLGDTYTEHADLFDSAIVDFFCDQMDGMYEDEDDPDLQEYYEARLACEEASALYGTDSEEYKQACLAFEEAERKAQVG